MRACLTVLTSAAVLMLLAESDAMAQTARPRSVTLPKPALTGRVPLERAITQRRSVREYARGALTLAEVSQLLWAAQGVTSPEGLRAVPSAGALYPLEVYLVAGEVTGLEPGVYHYEPGPHKLTAHSGGDRRAPLASAALAQECVREARAVIVVAAVEARTARKYRDRAPRYVHMEVGAAVQNVYLEATALDLGTVVVGAFEDDEVRRVLGLPADQQPLALLPVGRR